MADLPRGTDAFLFIYIEGSTDGRAWTWDAASVNSSGYGHQPSAVSPPADRRAPSSGGRNTQWSIPTRAVPAPPELRGEWSLAKLPGEALRRAELVARDPPSIADPLPQFGVLVGPSLLRCRGMVAIAHHGAPCGIRELTSRAGNEAVGAPRGSLLPGHSALAAQSAAPPGTATPHRSWQPRQPWPRRRDRP